MKIHFNNMTKYQNLFNIIFSLAMVFVLVMSVSCQSQTPAPAPPITGGGTPLAPGEPEEPVTPPQIEVFINESAFEPAIYNARVGSTIVWYNNASVEHTVTSRDTLFDSGNLSPGDTFRYTITPEVQETIEQSGAGALEYYCKIHPSMIGKLIIE